MPPMTSTDEDPNDNIACHIWVGTIVTMIPATLVTDRLPSWMMTVVMPSPGYTTSQNRTLSKGILLRAREGPNKSKS